MDTLLGRAVLIHTSTPAFEAAAAMCALRTSRDAAQLRVKSGNKRPST